VATIKIYLQSPVATAGHGRYGHRIDNTRRQGRIKA